MPRKYWIRIGSSGARLPQHDASSDRPTPTEIHDFLTFAMASYDVDPTPVYITGLSSGARGFWAYFGAVPR